MYFFAFLSKERVLKYKTKQKNLNNSKNKSGKEKL